MDGQHSVKELVIAYYQRYGVFALARVAGLVRLLREQRFLNEPPVDTYGRLLARLRGGRPVALPRGQLTTQAVDRLLGIAYRNWGRWFFHRVWLVVGIALGVLGPVLVLLELTRGRYVLYEIGGSVLATIVSMVLLALVALAIHELGHGLAVKHAGRRVHEAGVRLYFGLPAAFVDTSDIWMAPPRQRLLTAFAGPWTGLMLGGACAVAATLAPTGLAGGFLFTAAFVFLVDNLFNFNPLLELDGYYMLIDFLDRPMLRPRALAFVRGPLWSRIRRRQGLTRDELWLAWFGVGTMAYGLLALVLATRAWEALLLPLVVSNWESGEPLRQVASGLLVVAVGAPVLTAVIVIVRRLVTPAGDWLIWLSGRAAERRHSEALGALREVPLWAGLPRVGCWRSRAPCAPRMSRLGSRWSARARPANCSI